LKTLPDARLDAGEVVSFVEGIPLPNYEGLVYARLAGRDYILWASLNGDGKRDWIVVNSGSEIVQSALDQFLKEHSGQRLCC
jgi:hypothetical protein